MKRLFPIALLSSLLLLSCGGRNQNRDQTGCVQSFWNGSVGTCIPEGWAALTEVKLFEQGIPPEAEVAFQKSEPDAGQFPTVVVLKEFLPEGATTESYAEASKHSVAVYPSYRLITTRPVNVDDEEAEIHVFSARPIQDEPERRFYQVYAVSPKGVGYAFTALTPLSIQSDLEKEILTILGNVTFTEATETAAASSEEGN